MRFALLAPALAVFALVACGGADQTASCKRFLACELALGVSPDGGSISSADVAAFGPDGTCWLSASVAEACDQTCAQGLQKLSAQPGFAQVQACN